MTVYVWTADGKYVGQIIRQRFDQIEVLADDDTERAKIKGLLLDTDSFASTRHFDLRSGEVSRSFEFATDEWIELAALLVLPKAGYRVHVIKQPAPPTQ